MSIEKRVRWYRMCLCLLLAACGLLTLAYQRQYQRAKALRAELLQSQAEAAALLPLPPPEERRGYPVSQPPLPGMR